MGYNEEFSGQAMMCTGGALDIESIIWLSVGLGEIERLFFTNFSEPQFPHFKGDFENTGSNG